MQYRSPNATLGSFFYQTASIEWFTACFLRNSYCRVHPNTLLRYAYKRIVNIMEVYTYRNNLRLEYIQYSKKNVDFIHV